MDLLVVLVAGLFAGTLGGIVGTGSSLVLMPILVAMFGPRQAVPIMAVAAIMAHRWAPRRPVHSSVTVCR